MTTCVNYISATESRKREIEMGVGEVGTGSYEDYGCFNCPPSDYEPRYEKSKCKVYIGLNKIVINTEFDRRKNKR